MDPRVTKPVPLNRPFVRSWSWTKALLPLAACAPLAWPRPSQAQPAEVSFPSGLTGYDQQLGVTVLSRLRPEYEPLGVRLGSFVIRPEVDQSVFDNSNVTGLGAGSGSWGSQTGASVTAQSDWTRNSLVASAGVNHQQYFSLPHDSYTDWNVGIGWVLYDRG